MSLDTWRLLRGWAIADEGSLVFKRLVYVTADAVASPRSQEKVAGRWPGWKEKDREEGGR